MLNVDPVLLDLGLCACAVVVRGVKSHQPSPELVAYRKKSAARLAAFWKNRSISAHPAIAEYHRLHAQCGATNQPPAPEKLITYLRRKRDLTSAGALVDCYNLVSVRTLLSIGAHDIDKFDAPITLRTCTDDDSYVPLGQSDEQKLTGEYAYIDGQKHVICRLEVLQGDFSKVTPQSKDVAFFLQGNRYLPASILLKGAWLLAEMIEKFCGGKTELVAFHNAAANGESLGKSSIGIDDFKGLNLKVGTITHVEPHPTMPALSSVRVKLKNEVEGVSVATGLEVGKSAMVAMKLFPLTVGAKTYSTYVYSVQTEQASPLDVVADLPDGSGLR